MPEGGDGTNEESYLSIEEGIVVSKIGKLLGGAGNKDKNHSMEDENETQLKKGNKKEKVKMNPLPEEDGEEEEGDEEDDEEDEEEKLPTQAPNKRPPIPPSTKSTTTTALSNTHFIIPSQYVEEKNLVIKPKEEKEKIRIRRKNERKKMKRKEINHQRGVMSVIDVDVKLRK